MSSSITPLGTILVLCLMLINCSGPALPRDVKVEPFFPPTLDVGVIDEALMAKWARSCALCHVTGEAGAPVVGDTEAWQRRMERGQQSLMNSVLYGVNSMPPLGYCMSCEVADFRAMIVYMAGLNQ